MPNDYITKSYLDTKLDEKLDKSVTKTYFDNKLDKIMEKLDWLIGAYKKSDEEQTLLSGRVSDHDERIEVIEKKLKIYAN